MVGHTDTKEFCSYVYFEGEIYITIDGNHHERAIKKLRELNDARARTREPKTTAHKRFKIQFKKTARRNTEK